MYSLKTICLLLLGLVLAVPAQAQLHLDFETTGQLEAAIVAGDKAMFTEVSGQSHGGGSKALRFVPPAKQSFRSFTYDEPTGMTSGTITVWFYDVLGTPAVGSPTQFAWKMSIILEDANNPSDFGAVEIANLPYGAAQPYYPTEGSVNRFASNTLDSAINAPRSQGWHRVDFVVGTTVSLIRVDGATATRVGAPGSDKTLRLRFMADSATVGGFSNWTSTTGSSYPADPGLIYIDDISFNESLPTAEVRTLSFEGSGATADYDIVDEFMGPAPHSEPLMQGFVNHFDVGTTVTHPGAGANAATYTGGTPVLQSLTFDLSGLDLSSTHTATVWFYDSLGANADSDKIGGAIMVENGTDPSNFIAMEIWNFQYPFSAGDPNYYLTSRPIPATTTGFFSSYFGDRSIGWHRVDIILTETSSRILVDGIENDNATSLRLGPGLNTNPKLRIMADSPSMGGFNNYATSALWLDPSSPELNILYLDKTSDYVVFDDITVPQAVTAARQWMVYE